MAITGKSFTSVFPMDSEWELDEGGEVRLDPETGLPIADRAYNASDLRSVISAYVSDGVVTDRGDELVTTVEGGSVFIGAGTAFANGLLIDVTEKTKVADLSDVPTGSYLFAVVQARFDQPNRDGYPTARVVQSTSLELTRNESLWELAVARVDWRGTVTDLRMDQSYCGPVSAVVPVDTESFMRALYTAVDQFNLNVGEVASLPSGSTPTVTVRKPVEAGGEVFVDFGIPRGAPGEPGQSAPGVYVQEGRPTSPSEGTLWLGTDPGTRQIEHVECYEVTGTYPGEAYPGERYPGGTAAWAAYTIDPALLTGAQQS